MSDQRESVASSEYSGHSGSVEVAKEQKITKIEGEAMKKSAESAKTKRRENQKAKEEREKAGK